MSNLAAVREILELLRGEASVANKEGLFSLVAAIPVAFDSEDSATRKLSLRKLQCSNGMKVLSISTQEEWRRRVRSIVEMNDGSVTEAENTELLRISMYQQDKLHKFEVIIFDSSPHNAENLRELLRLLKPGEDSTGYSLVRSLPIIMADDESLLTELERAGFSTLFPSLSLPPRLLSLSRLLEAMERSFQYNVGKLFAEECAKNTKSVLIMSASSRFCDVVEHIASRHFFECSKCDSFPEAFRTLNDSESYITTVVTTKDRRKDLREMIKETRQWLGVTGKRQVRYMVVADEAETEEWADMACEGILVVLDIMDLNWYFSQHF